MPAFIAAIGGMLINIVGTLVGRVMVALGLGLVTYTGVSATIDKLRDDAVGQMMGLPPEILAILQLTKIGVGLSIITSAITVRLILNGLTSGAVKRWVTK